MSKLKLTEIPDETPVKVTVDLPAALHRDLVRYAELIADGGARPVEPVKLIVPMLKGFMAGDRGFAAARRSRA